MTVILEIDATLVELMTAMGIGHELVHAAEANGLEVKYTLQGVTILEPATKSQADAPIKMGVLQSILNGTLPGGAAKNLLKVQLEKAVKFVLAEVGAETKTPAFLEGQAKAPNVNVEVTAHNPGQTAAQLEAIFGGKPKSEITKKPPYTWTAAEVVTKPATDKPTFLKHEGVMPNKCKLIDATALYQPVEGSDPNSTYFCIALSAGLKVAVRMKTNQKISIRAEGAKLTNFSGQLVTLGMSAGGNHYSVHLSCDSVELARKSVGAVLMGIGADFDAVATNLQKIYGKGQ